MRLKLLAFLFIISILPLSAQTHVSVPLDSYVYHFLEQAALRGLCAPLSGIRPYTRNVVIKAINEILTEDNADRLRVNEREILQQYLNKLTPPKTGFDWQRGTFRSETTIGNNEILLSANLGIGADISGSAGLYPSSGRRYWGMETWGQIFLNGDIGRKFSWDINVDAGLTKVPRSYLGEYNTFYDGFEAPIQKDFVNRVIPIYSEPLTHFPYTYQKRWDGSVHLFNYLEGFSPWPNDPAIGYSLLSEMTASFMDDIFIMRLGRISHEWGSSPLGSSLALNTMARPFLGIEAEFRPVSWFGIATMTGFLEFFNTESQKISAMSFQNAYSITMLQFRFRNILFLDFGEMVIWPKRFELGYIFPLTSSIVYKGNVGDYDNLAFVFNLMAQYPGIGNIWFSLFWDEARGLFNNLDNTMVAYQAGMNFPLPVMSFSSLKLSYTKVNPYCYTHLRVFTPFYGGPGGGLPMEQSYTNNGESLGYYTPPNSDEILISFKTMPFKNLMTNFQYQMIRRGADFGSSAVDGSNLLSELDPQRDWSNHVTRRFFLRDGAYQWMHIVRVSADWHLPSLPVALFGEAGVVYSYFTNIDAPANITGRAHPYSRVNTPEYPTSTGFIATIGVKIFPR